MPDLDDLFSSAIACVSTGEPKDTKDWEPLRQLARKRARITLTTVWEDPAKGWKLHRADFRRFCYRDYAKQKQSLAITETPDTLALKTDTLITDGGGKRTKQVNSHYIVSLRRGRLAVYHRSRTGKVQHTMPGQICLTPCVSGTYPEATARFSKQLTRMVRRKARAAGVKLAKGDDLKAVLTATLWPALEAVKAHHKAVRNGVAWVPDQAARWLLRHMHCEPYQLPKEMTGYGSKAVTKLLWESMRPPAPRFNEQGAQFVTSMHDANLWRSKWAWLACLRTWLPVDYTQQVLRAERIAVWDDSFSKDPRPVRKLLKQWEPKRVARMLTETCADSSTIRDTLGMLERRQQRLDRDARWAVDHPEVPVVAAEPLPRTRDAKELHDWLSAEVNRVWERERQMQEARRRAAMTPEQRAAEEEREKLTKAPFKHSDELLSVAGRQVTTPDGVQHTLTLPTGPEDLALWGQGMHNCIGGYGDWIRSGHCLILGVKSAGSERACDWGVEIRQGEIVQFRGVCNVDAPTDLQNAVEAVLLEAKVLDPLKAVALRMNVQVETQVLRALMADMAPGAEAAAPAEHNDAADALEIAVHALRAA